MGTPGQLSFPNGIVVDSHGNIEVADSNNGRLVVFNVAGKMLATISPGVGEGDLGLPRGAAVDDSGRLFVVDTSDHMVRVYTIGDLKAPRPPTSGPSAMRDSSTERSSTRTGSPPTHVLTFTSPTGRTTGSRCGATEHGSEASRHQPPFQ